MKSRMKPRINRTPKTPRKKRVVKLSKRAKLDIIIEYMTDNPGAQLRRGFQKALIQHFRDNHDIKVDHGYMSRLIKEAKELLGKQQGYLYSKREYLLQHNRLGRLLKDTQDGLFKTKEGDETVTELKPRVGDVVAIVGAQRDNIKDMEKLEGHLKDVHVFEGGDAEKTKQIEDYFDDKTGKKAAPKKGGDHGKE